MHRCTKHSGHDTLFQKTGIGRRGPSSVGSGAAERVGGRRAGRGRDDLGGDRAPAGSGAALARLLGGRRLPREGVAGPGGDAVEWVRFELLAKDNLVK